MSTVVSIAGLNEQGASPRWEQIANALSQAIRSGQLKPGDRLPTIRALATDLGVSITTVTAAFRSLAENGWTRGVTGRGTFVAERVPPGVASAPLRTPPAYGGPRRKNAWRRRALVSLMERLRSSFPHAVNCSFGAPGPSMLPLKLIKRHWAAAFDDITGLDLQYKTADPVEVLTETLTSRLKKDGIPVSSGDLLTGTSAQQFMVLAASVTGRATGRSETVIAVEQPGYYTIFDAWDHAGVRMIGIETDESGAIPESLESAIRNGANAVLLTPRAHNPTGASWIPERIRALGDVLSQNPQVVAIEDDHFGDIADEPSGSLLGDPRIEERVIYIRSFSKSIAPDLRLCVAAARSPLKTLLQEAKGHADGWSSRLLQRVLAGVLQDDALDSWLARAKTTYRTRRARVAEVFANCGVPGLVIWPVRNGVNLWIQLPPGFDAGEIIERGAALGVLAAPGEVFYLSPGHNDVIRFNVGSVETEEVSACAHLLVKAIQQSRGTRSTAIYV